MRPVSDAFLRAVRGSHRMTARARVVSGLPTGTAPDGADLPILSGDVTLDAAADVRGSLELETSGAGMWPSASTSLLTPFGNEVFVERGIAFGNGLTEWVSLGYFRIDSAEQETGPDGPIRISARDRMAGIVDARLLAPRQFTATTTRLAVLTALVHEVYPSAVIEWTDPTGGDALGRTLITEDDRFAFLNDLVTAAGMVWFWDYRGHLVVQPPAISPEPVYEVNQGEGGVLVSMARHLTRSGVYNAVVATGEAADTVAPARAVAVDNNPKSPTYYYGAFGKVPRFYSSPVITTNAQAASAAAAILRQALGLPYAVSFGTVPNPALEPGDVVTVTYPSRSRSWAGRSETHVIDRLNIPLTADGAQTAQTREQTLVVIGDA